MNHYWTSFFIYLLGISICCPALQAAQDGTLILAENGKIKCRVVVAKSADELDITAAKTLSEYLGKITGTAPSVVHEPVNKSLVNIYVGKTERAKSVFSSTLEGLGIDGIVIKTIDDGLVLTGKGTRGPIYAVYTFLEDNLGCRWYASDMDEIVPRDPNLSVPAQNTVYTPPFEYRQLYTEAVVDPMMRLTMKMNGGEWAIPIEEKYGGSLVFGGGHSLIDRFMKPKDYFEQHPDWYAYRKAEGKRLPTQLCLTNPQAREAMVKEVLRHLEETGDYVVSVGLADNNAVCECENCSAIAAREDSYSGVLIDFANYVAEQVEKPFPNVKISILAYWPTERPPKSIKVHKNVIVIFGVLDRNHKHDISQVANYSRYLEQWVKLSSQVYMWDYDPHFANFIQPHPNHTVEARSIQFYKKMGVKGIYVQGSWGSAGEFMHLRAWVNAHMMWDPTKNYNALMEEFASAYYGNAGPTLVSYIDLIDKAVNRQKDTWLGVYTGDTSNWLTLDDLNEATRLFDKAIGAVVDNPKQLYRVKRAKLSIDAVWMQRYRQLRFEAEKRGVDFLGPKDMFQSVDEFFNNEFKINTYREWDNLTGYRRLVDSQLFPIKGKVPVECENLEDYQWVDIHNDLIKAIDATESSEVSDSAASDGKALYIKGSDLAMQAVYELPRNLAGKWRVYMTLRSKPGADGKAGVAVGIYAPGELLRTTVDFDNKSFETYKTVDMGVYELGPDAKIWAQPNGPGSYGEKEGTWIDRIFLVHVK